MYSPLVVDKTLHRYHKQGLQFKRRSIDESLTITEKLTAIYNQGKPTRAFTSAEQAFIDSEILLCRADFRYVTERYLYTEMDAGEGGGIGPARLWPSQERAIELISAREELCYEEFEKHNFCEGIRCVWHKTRQQGATGLTRLMNGQRMVFFKYTRSIAASLDEPKVQELYKRDKILLDNLPFFTKPELGFDVKNQHITLDWTKSTLTYQQANQQAGIGTGQQFDFTHMTEIAMWRGAERLEFDFLPAVPKALSTFLLWESTAKVRGDFWYEFTENVRQKSYGFGNWIYIFTPCYLNTQKNRLIAPDAWTPNDVTQRQAALIETTSPEFCGKKIVPDRHHLYWWEMEYERNRQMGSLAVFLTNYPATPEQSFQYAQDAALPIETIEWMRTSVLPGMPYAIDYRENRI